MPKTIEAIYEDGVFRPLTPVKGLKKHQRVTITVEKSLERRHPLHGLCGILPDKDAKEMLKIIEEEFEKVNIDEW
jgi:predicted DNA-binding antitoxin AbrB/MazE fold protein